MPTIAMGSSAGPPGTDRPLPSARSASPPSAACPPRSCSRRKSVSAPGVGWSKTSVAGRRCPVAAFRRLRSSTAVSESKPRSLNGRAAETVSGVACPRTVATCARTTSSRARFCSSRPRPASCRARPPAAGASAAAAAVRRATVRTSPWKRGRSMPEAASLRRVAVSRRTGTRWASSRAVAASSRARPRSDGSGRMPARRIQARSSCSRCPSMSPEWAHRPQARECAGRPRARRCTARASRKALAAA